MALTTSPPPPSAPLRAPVPTAKSEMRDVFTKYMFTSSRRVLLLDSLIVLSVVVLLLQVLYALLRGSTFPFNALLSGVGCCVGVFVVTGECLEVVHGCLCACKMIFLPQSYAKRALSFPFLSRSRFSHASESRRKHVRTNPSAIGIDTFDIFYRRPTISLPHCFC